MAIICGVSILGLVRALTSGILLRDLRTMEKFPFSLALNLIPHYTYVEGT
jgi:hypothetical protein